MKKILSSFVFVMVFFNVYAEDFLSGQTYYVPSFSDDYINVQYGATVVPTSGDTILITSAGIIINNDGFINADIDTNNHNLYIRNGGSISGNIIISDGYQVTQIIQSASDIQSLNVAGNHVVNVEINNFDGMANLNQLKGLQHTGAFQITNSDIIMDSFAEWQGWDKEIHLAGRNTLYINNPETAHSGDVIAHVTNAANVNVVLLNSGNLYNVTIQSVGSGAVLNITRETDYDKVIEDEGSGFFKELREKHIDDRLLRALDSASNMNEFYRVMNSSYRFNHSILMRPVKAITNFSLVNMFDYEKDVGLRFSPSYIVSGDFNSYEARVDVGGSYQDLYLNIGMYFDRFKYENEYNDFAGSVYGTDVKIKKYIDDFWVNGVAGFSLVDFDADYIYVKNDIKNNPCGYSLYGGIDGGYDYKVFDDFIISPFVGGVFQNLKVLDFSDRDMALRAGGNAKYAFAMDGIRYEYSASAAIATNGDMFANIKTGFVSVVDAAGVFIGLDVYKDEYDINYRLLLSGKVTF